MLLVSLGWVGVPNGTGNIQGTGDIQGTGNIMIRNSPPW